MSVFSTGFLNCRGVLEAAEILYTTVELALNNKPLPAGVWTDANTLFNIPVGSALAYQNLGATTIIGNLSDTQPLPSQLDGFVAQQYEYRTITAGSKKLWLRTLAGDGLVIGEAV